MILLGPVLRYVDATRATVWFETDAPGELAVVRADGVRHTARTWCVHGHHYALVILTDLPPASATEYSVTLDGETAWPPADSEFPPSVIRTLDGRESFRLAFGSCRVAAPFDDENLERFGADALAALALRMASGPYDLWPDALFLAGDQIYADEPSDDLRARLRDAHTDESTDDPDDVREEIGNFEEYTWLYHESWTPAPIRWLLSTVPTCMLLDDHDLRDDWNTSQAWRERVTAEDWWHDRVVGAFASYWIYQHLGNLSPDELAADPVYPVVTAEHPAGGDDERTQRLDEFAWRSDAQPDSARWSFHRDFGPGIRLVAVDARCSRVLDPADRHIVDAVETEWLIERATERPFEHLIFGSTLPFLLTPGVHHLEGWDEAVAGGAWGRRASGVGEKIRQALDLEHWSAFRRSFDAVVDLFTRIATSPEPPRTITLLGGDVHCSYTARAVIEGVDPARPAIHQLTMSPFRNPLQKSIRVVQRAMTTRPLIAALRGLARSAKVTDPPIRWTVDHGPWFDNGVMTLVLAGPEASVEVEHATVEDGEQRLVRTLTLPLTGPAPEPGRRRRRRTGSRRDVRLRSRGRRPMGNGRTIGSGR